MMSDSTMIYRLLDSVLDDARDAADALGRVDFRKHNVDYNAIGVARAMRKIGEAIGALESMTIASKPKKQKAFLEK